MNKKKCSLLVVMVIILLGLSFCMGLYFNPQKRAMHKAQLIGDEQIKNMADESYMTDRTLSVEEVYEVRRTFPDSDEPQAVVYINKKDGQILNRDVKDMTYIKK